MNSVTKGSESLTMSMKLEWKGAPRAGKVECNEVLIVGIV